MKFFSWKVLYFFQILKQNAWNLPIFTFFTLLVCLIMDRELLCCFTTEVKSAYAPKCLCDKPLTKEHKIKNAHSEKVNLNPGRSWFVLLKSAHKIMSFSRKYFKFINLCNLPHTYSYSCLLIYNRQSSLGETKELIHPGKTMISKSWDTIFN